jgi:hypothetical protein
MKITIEYDDDEQAKHALKAMDYFSSLLEMDEWLRSQIKYGNIPSEVAATYQKARDQLSLILEEYDVSLYT